MWVQSLQDNFLELVLFFHYMGPRAPIQALVLVSGSLYRAVLTPYCEPFDRAFIGLKAKIYKNLKSFSWS